MPAGDPALGQHPWARSGTAPQKIARKRPKAAKRPKWASTIVQRDWRARQRPQGALRGPGCRRSRALGLWGLRRGAVRLMGVWTVTLSQRWDGLSEVKQTLKYRHGHEVTSRGLFHTSCHSLLPENQVRFSARPHFHPGSAPAEPSQSPIASHQTIPSRETMGVERNKKEGNISEKAV